MIIKNLHNYVLKGRKPAPGEKSVKSGKTLEEIFNEKSKISYKKWLLTGANIRYKNRKKL